MAWRRIPEAGVKERVRNHCPLVASWREDPWSNPPEVFYRAACDGDRVQFALHYVWTRPDWAEICRAHPDWSLKRRIQAMGGLRAHEEKWGPGDVELVVLTLREDRCESIDIRLRLRPFDLIQRPWDLLKRLVRRQPLERRKSYPAKELLSDGASSFVLCAAHSEHHEWKEPPPRPGLRQPVFVHPMTGLEWIKYEMDMGGGSGRAHLEWEREPVDARI